MSTEGVLDELLRALDAQLPGALELRRRLHADPELAHAEHRTAATVSAELPVQAEPVAGTGLLARVGAGGAPVAVRAELDGLPIAERTGRLLQRERRERCTPAGTTSTWLHSSP